MNAAVPPSALIVDPLAADRVAAGSALVAAGFHVTVSDTFASAKDRMAARPPTVLITDVRLAEYNGIHLVIRGLAHGQRLAAVVTSEHDDPVLRDSAGKLGATFAVKPLNARELVAAVVRTLLRDLADQVALRPPFERRSADRRTSWGSVPPVERRLADRRQGIARYLSGTIN